MKTSNTQPSGQKAGAAALGYTNTNQAAQGLRVTADGIEVLSVTSIEFVGPGVADLGDDGIRVDTSTETTVGEVTPDETPFTISSGADFRGFPGAAWLDDPAATEHGVGDKFLIVYYHGDTHLLNSRVVGKIATVTDTDPWTYTLGSEFDIENIAANIRCEDAVSVLDIGGGDYRAVVLAREYTAAVNTAPHVLICDDPSDTMTSASTWTRHNVALSGHTQDLGIGRVHQLANGRYMIAFIHLTGAVVGGTHVMGVAWVTDITDWSAPTFVEISNGTSQRDEFDFEEVSPGTIYINIRNDSTGVFESAVSTDSGDTWSAPATLFTATYFPMWRVLNSGIGLSVHADAGGSLHTAYRQTPTGITDSGWGSQVILDSTASYMDAYSTILQLDNNHVLVIYGVESMEADPVDSDLYSQVFTDSSTFGSNTALVLVSASDDTPGYLEDKIVAGTGVAVTKTGTDNETLTVAVDDAPATEITVADAGAYFVGATVEAVLAELGARAYAGEILITDTPAGSPLIFADLIQNEAQTDLVYADP